MMRVLISSFLLLMCAACSTDQTVEGIYFFSHETSAFVTCGTNDRWWFDGKSDEYNTIVDLYTRLIDEPYGNLYLVVQGKFTKKLGNLDYVGIFEPIKMIDHSIDEKLVTKCVPEIKQLK